MKERTAFESLRRWAPPAGLVALLLLALALPLLDPSVQLFDRDTGRCEYPFKHEMAARLLRGELPLWVPWTEAGTSLLGQMTPALFHPATLLFALLPFSLAFKLDHLLAIALCALGAALLARRLGADRWGAAAAGAAYAGSGWVVSMAASNVHYAFGAAAVPLAIDGLLRLLHRPTALGLLWSGFALALTLLGGEPQSALFAGLLGAGFLLARTPWQRRPLLRAGGLLSFWLAVGALLSAPASLPVALRLPSSPRAQAQGSESAYFALPPLRVFALLLPWAFDETTEQQSPEQGRTPYSEYAHVEPQAPFSSGLTLGAPALLCALALRGRRARWLGLGALVCLLAAMGPALPLERLLQLAVPPLRLFRFPEKWLAPATLLLCLAAGLGLSRALGGARSRARKLVVASIALATALGAGDLAVHLSLGPLRERLIAFGRTHATFAADAFLASLQSALFASALLALALALVAALRWRGSNHATRLARPSAALLCAGAAWLCSSGLLYTTSRDLLEGPFPLAGQLRERDRGETPRIDSDPDHPISLGSTDWRAGAQWWFSRALATQFNGLAGVESVAVYSSLGDRDYLDAWHLAPAAMTSLFAVRFQMRSPWALSVDEAQRAGFEPTNLGMWVRERPPEPRAFLLGCALPLERQAALRAMGDGAFDPHRTATLALDDRAAAEGLPCPAAPAPLAAPNLSRLSPEQIAVEVDGDAPALLVLAEHFDPGWSVSIDGGRAQPALQIDRAALGARIPAGAHRLLFRFFPRGLAAGLWLSGLCALSLGLLHRLRSRAQPLATSRA